MRPPRAARRQQAGSTVRLQQQRSSRRSGAGRQVQLRRQRLRHRQAHRPACHRTRCSARPLSHSSSGRRSASRRRSRRPTCGARPSPRRSPRSRHCRRNRRRRCPASSRLPLGSTSSRSSSSHSSSRVRAQCSRRQHCSSSSRGLGPRSRRCRCRRRSWLMRRSWPCCPMTCSTSSWRTRSSAMPCQRSRPVAADAAMLDVFEVKLYIARSRVSAPAAEAASAYGTLGACAMLCECAAVHRKHGGSAGCMHCRMPEGTSGMGKVLRC